MSARQSVLKKEEGAIPPFFSFARQLKPNKGWKRRLFSLNFSTIGVKDGLYKLTKLNEGSGAHSKKCRASRDGCILSPEPPSGGIDRLVP